MKGRPASVPYEKLWKVEVRCRLCERCYLDPFNPGRCIYGGPFAGTVTVTAGREGAVRC